MNLIHRTLTGCFGMLLIPGMLYAHCGQCGMGDAKSGGKMEGAVAHDPLEMMSKELTLSEDQKTKIKAIKEDKHKKMHALHDDAHAKIKAVLTKDQQAKFDKMDMKSCGLCGKGDASHKH